MNAPFNPPSKANRDVPTFTKLTHPQVFAIGNALRAALIENGVTGEVQVEDGRVTYKPGWTDQRIAEEVIPGYPGRGAQAVGAVRVKLFGSIKPPAKPPSPPTARDALEARVAYVESILRDLGYAFPAVQA